VIGFAFEAQSGVDAIGSDATVSAANQHGGWIPPGCFMFSRSPIGGEYRVLHGIEITTDRAWPLNIMQSDAVAAAFARCVEGPSRDRGRPRL